MDDCVLSVFTNFKFGAFGCLSRLFFRQDGERWRVLGYVLCYSVDAQSEDACAILARSIDKALYIIYVTGNSILLE